MALGSDGTESQHLLFAEGRCEGRVTGSLHGANYPCRRGDWDLCPDFHAAYPPTMAPRFCSSAAGMVALIQRAHDRSFAG